MRLNSSKKFEFIGITLILFILIYASSVSAAYTMTSISCTNADYASVCGANHCSGSKILQGHLICTSDGQNQVAEGETGSCAWEEPQVDCATAYSGTCQEGNGCVEIKSNGTTCADGYNATCEYYKQAYPLSGNGTTTCTPDCSGHDAAACSTSNVSLCTTSSDCSGIGYNWCDVGSGTYACQGSPCQSSSPSGCSSSSVGMCTQAECSGAGGYWNSVSFTCDPTPAGSGSSGTCSAGNYSACNVSNCNDVGGYWCFDNSQCYSDAAGCSSACNSTSVFYCYNINDCTNAGGNWCASSNYCYSDSENYTCGGGSNSSCQNGDFASCYSSTDCTNVGGSWCSNNSICYSSASECSSTGTTCSSDNPSSCYSNSACTGAGGRWCSNSTGTTTAGTGYCQRSTTECPTYACSSNYSDLGYCNTETECTNVGGSWCSNSPGSGGYNTGTSGYCGSSGSCPTYECSTTDTSSCSTQSECTDVGANWCASSSTQSYCSTSNCPTCSTTSRSNCYTQNNCTTAGGVWCASGSQGYCQEANTVCPTCTTNNKYACSDQQACTDVGGTWCGRISNPYTQPYYGCEESAAACPVCSAQTPTDCFTEQECLAVSGSWSVQQGNGYCQQSTNNSPRPGDVCSITTPYACNTPSECEAVGYWCDSSFTGGYPGCARSAAECAQGPPPSVCGDGFCEYDEYDSCRADCRRTTVCPTDADRQLKTEQCRNAEGIARQQSSADGCTYVVCEYEEQSVCPTPEKQRERISACENAGNNWRYNQSQNGCKYIECLPAAICPSDEEVRQLSQRCETLQLEPFFSSDYYGCPVVRCEQPRRPIVDPPIETERCEAVFDEYTGFRYVCDYERDTCPSLANQADVKQACVEAGGRPEIGVGFYGCEFYKCDFEKQRPLLEGYCPSKKELEKITQSCEADGYTTVRERALNGCTYVKCASDQEYEYQFQTGFEQCPVLPFDELRTEQDLCLGTGGKFIEDFDFATGCPRYVCLAIDEAESCADIQPPAGAFQKCEQKGGELVVRRDGNQCPVFVECLNRGSNIVEVDEVTEDLDSAAALQLALNLERLIIIVERLELQSQELAEYYAATNRSRNSERFSLAQGMFGATRDEIESIRLFLSENANDITAEVVQEIKVQIKYIKNVVLKDILFILLSSKPETPGTPAITNCEDSEQCFVRNLRVCDPAFMEQTEEGFSGRIEITGLSGEACVVKARAQFLGEDYDMTCNFENFAFADLGPSAMQQYCSGTLIDKMNETGIKSSATANVVLR
jgi:hypothetical protein